MKFEDILGLMIPLTYVAMLGIEQWRPGREYPRIKAWKSTGGLFVLVLLSINVILPSLLPVDWIARHRFVDGTSLGVIGGAVVGYLVLSLVNYAWHRAEHRYDLLWRGFHQLHHSPTRVDISGSAFTHPSEVVVMVLLSLFVTVLVLGLDPQAAALTGYIGAFYSMFQHWNIRTPRWLGYLIQRPESHGHHHERGIHASNYSDLPLWDIVFGTFRNPESFTAEVGFDPAMSRRIGAMLAGIDVNSEPARRTIEA